MNKLTSKHLMLIVSMCGLIGIVLGLGVNVSGVFFSPILTSLIQSTGWRTAYVITAVIMAIFALPAILFPIGMYPEDAGTQPYGVRSQQAAAQAAEPSKVPLVLFLIASCYACICCYGTAMPQHFPGIAESYQFSASVGAMMLSTAMICNTGGKVLLGILADAMGQDVPAFSSSPWLHQAASFCC